MTEREWIEKDFYAELGVSSSATADEIKKAYRKLARDLHPDKNPGNTKAEDRFKAVGEAYSVLSNPDKRKQYDETRALFNSGARGGGGFGGFGGGGFGTGAGGFGGSADINLEDLLNQAAAGGARTSGGGGLGDLFGGLFGGGTGAGRSGGTRTSGRSRRGADVESEIRLPFAEAVRGATVALRLTSPGRCDRCGGTGARPGSAPRTCPTCDGHGMVTNSQGHFAFSEPCRDCRGTGRIIDDPCPDCGGDGVKQTSRTLNVRIPAGVVDGQKIRIKGRGEPGLGGAPAGDLFVLVHVGADARFGRSERNPDDLTLTVPVTYPELALGATLTVPTLDGRVSLKVPAGTASGRTFRVRGRGVRKSDDKAGDLLVTVEVAVPPGHDEEASAALRSYAESIKSFDPRARLLGDQR